MAIVLAEITFEVFGLPRIWIVGLNTGECK